MYQVSSLVGEVQRTAHKTLHMRGDCMVSFFQSVCTIYSVIDMMLVQIFSMATPLSALGYCEVFYFNSRDIVLSKEVQLIWSLFGPEMGVK